MTYRSSKPISAVREADIQRMIAADPDAPEATDEELAQAKPFAAAFPDLVSIIHEAQLKSVTDAPSKQITIRLDSDVIDKFRATGKGWQSRINEILKKVDV